MACPVSSTSSLLRSSLRAAPRQASSSSSSPAASSSRFRPRTFASSSSSSSSIEAAESSSSAPSITAPRSFVAPQKTINSNANIKVSLLLSRQPLILRQPTPLEAAYFEYNHALTRRLSQPFVKDFYFRKGSAAETKFDAEEIERRQNLDFPAEAASSSSSQQAGKTKGPASLPPSSDSSLSSEPTTTATAAVAENPDAELYATMPRTTKADESGDVTSLERALDRTLFLLFKDGSSGQWRLPERKVDLTKQETLHRVADKPVKEALGDKLDIWLVSHLPIGVAPRPVEGQGVRSDGSERTYFLRGHLVSGAPRSVDGREFAWLTKEEIEERLGGGQSKEYFETIGDFLSD